MEERMKKDDMGLWEIAVKFGTPIVCAILKTVAEKSLPRFFSPYKEILYEGKEGKEGDQDSSAGSISDGHGCCNHHLHRHVLCLRSGLCGRVRYSGNLQRRSRIRGIQRD